MDPLWSEIKRILKIHEDIFEGSRVQLKEYAANFKNVDEMMKAIFQRIESFEKESQRTFSLEHTVAMLLQTLDSLEQEYYWSKAREEDNHRISELERIVENLLCHLDSLEKERNQP
jgi:molecular chaperone GrpE (heat shock protein)